MILEAIRVLGILGGLLVVTYWGMIFGDILINAIKRAIRLKTRRTVDGERYHMVFRNKAFTDEKKDEVDK